MPKQAKNKKKNQENTNEKQKNTKQNGAYITLDQMEEDTAFTA